MANLRGFRHHTQNLDPLLHSVGDLRLATLLFFPTVFKTIMTQRLIYDFPQGIVGSLRYDPMIYDGKDGKMNALGLLKIYS